MSANELTKTEEIKLSIKNLFFDGVLLINSETFKEVLQYGLDNGFVTVTKRKNKYFVKIKEQE
ncbi:MAG: hypothetical protein RBR93_12205 [Aliarcobacter butzleri]|uniref:hypothetical protein n=1 Tax=Aliarcobacter butzleri TaxID=28197 RepID=UPI001ED9CCAB|nr:hypothetical protein [Aliarcobacter butzleri]MCG3655972.1 hypothetical protein [Aliarcobacter butzleri]MDY0194268.1 hypothetical protein [Aliarcobacter butzleri]